MFVQLSSAIRAALIALTVTGAGLTTVYADFGSIRFNVIKATRESNGRLHWKRRRNVRSLMMMMIGL
jgi:hypothetical protein